MSLFEANYRYALRTLLSPRQVKKLNKIAKEREIQLEAMYIPGKITEEFVTEFYKGTTQEHNGAIVLITRLR